MKLKNNWIKYSNLGFQILITLFIFGGLGFYLDTVAPNKAPLFFISGSLLGAFIALYHLWKIIFK